MRHRDPECMLCGRDEFAHHDFAERENGCICPSWDGSDECLDICKAFTPWSADASRCNRCEHDRKCHASEKATP